MTKPTVFISHVSDEAALAGILKRHLIEDFPDLLRVFVSSDMVSIEAGQDWLLAIKDALHDACVQLVLFSNASLQRPWINFEAGAAWIRDVPVVPVCHSGLSPVDLPMPFAVLQAIVLSDASGIGRLYSLLAKRLGVLKPPATNSQLLDDVAAYENASASHRRSKTAFDSHSLDDQWGMHVGAVWVPWVVASYGPYRPDNIISHYNPSEPDYPQDIQHIFHKTSTDIAAREVLGEDVPYDSEDFKLTRFHVSSRTVQLEEPRLVLHFAPTTYFRMLATDQHLDVQETHAGRTYTLREMYASKADLRVRPVAEFATHWGVGLGVITADNLFLISERGNTAVDAHVYFPSIAEGATRAKDSAGNGAPDHFSIARRGMQEELGVDLHQSELTWLSFGANAVLCEYALIGRVDSKYTSEEIRRRRSAGLVKDGWESTAIHSIPFDPVEIARFCSDRTRRFSPFAMVTIFHCLINEFGFEDVDGHFKSASIRITQKLPEWLIPTP